MASITRANAQKYVAGILGGARSPQLLDSAEEAILRAFEDWQAAKFWRFLLKDTARGFQVTGLTQNLATLTAPSAGAFDGVNIGVTVTVSGSGATLAGGTTVSSYTRNTDGTVATITLTNAVSGAAGAYTATFGGNIPLIVGVSEYNAPPDFGSYYGGRTTLNQKRPVDFIEYRDWNRVILDHTVQGIVEAITVYNPDSELTQNYGTKRLRTFRIPSAADVFFMQFYRSFNKLADPLDIPDHLQYKFMDYARWRLLESKTGHDDRLPNIEKMALGSLAQAMADDEEVSEDMGVTFKSQMDAFREGDGGRRLWTNGEFWP